MPRTRRSALALLAGALALLAGGPAAVADSGDVAYDAGLQWHLRTIGAEAAWATSRGAGVVIAVVDSGVAVDHEDLAAKLLPGVACEATGGDPARCTGSPQDDDGHGTHVAGIAAAVTGNGVGVAGTAPDASILPVKVLFRRCDDCELTGRADDVAAAVRWAVDQGADVVNLSLGSASAEVFGPELADAVTYAWSAGAIPVVAAGNEQVLTADLGDAPAVLVTATTRDDAIADYSRRVGATRWALAAPGGDASDDAGSCSQAGQPRGILSTYWAPDDPTHAYACLSGTSMAAPQVSGALALLLGAGLAPEDAVRRLLDTAVDLGVSGVDDVFGAGRLDVAAAVAGTIRPGAAAPGAPSPTPPAAPAPPRAQRFDADPDEGLPPLVVLVALAGVLGTGAASELARRRLS